jgi:tellurite resistance protein TerC
MSATPLAWQAALLLIGALVAYDYFFHVRKAHVPSLREAALWSAGYVGVALLFGVAVLVLGGRQMGMEYFAGYVTEKALSVDNVFVFLVIMASFKVPREDQQKALLFGIVFALIARTAFIFLGSALIETFAWIFYLFGVALLLTAGNLIKHKPQDEEVPANFMVRLVRRVFHATDYYDGDKLFTMHEGRRALTPMLLVMIAIGGTDILFALDSIPAIFGLTTNVFVVFTATAFSLLGLRQLFFLVEGMLERLVYLSYGLAAILAFIGVKLILHALHENNLPFVNQGEPVNVIEISTGTSLAVIAAVLLVTIVASLASPRGKANAAINALRQHATHYLDADYPVDAPARERIYAALVEAERRVNALPAKYQAMIKDRHKLDHMLRRAHRKHEAGSDSEPA